MRPDQVNFNILKLRGYNRLDILRELNICNSKYNALLNQYNQTDGRTIVREITQVGIDQSKQHEANIISLAEELSKKYCQKKDLEFKKLLSVTSYHSPFQII
jgi:hypothetical protein